MQQPAWAPPPQARVVAARSCQGSAACTAADALVTSRRRCPASRHPAGRSSPPRSRRCARSATPRVRTVLMPRHALPPKPAFYAPPPQYAGAYGDGGAHRRPVAGVTGGVEVRCYARATARTPHARSLMRQRVRRIMASKAASRPRCWPRCAPRSLLARCAAAPSRRPRGVGLNPAPLRGARRRLARSASARTASGCSAACRATTRVSCPVRCRRGAAAPRSCRDSQGAACRAQARRCSTTSR